MLALDRCSGCGQDATAGLISNIKKCNQNFNVQLPSHGVSQVRLCPESSKINANIAFAFLEVEF